MRRRNSSIPVDLSKTESQFRLSKRRNGKEPFALVERSSKEPAETLESRLLSQQRCADTNASSQCPTKCRRKKCDCSKRLEPRSSSRRRQFRLIIPTAT